MNNTVVLVAGGDLRQFYAAKKLSEKFRVYVLGFDNISRNTCNAELLSDISLMPEKADCLLLPLPVSDDGINLSAPFCIKKVPLLSLKPFLKKNAVVTGGRMTVQTDNIFSDTAVTSDYTKREEFCVLNAVPTAEAAVEIAIQKSESTLYKSKILITGFGRISKALVKILSGFGTDITVAARKKSDLSWAEIYGCKAVDIKEIAKTANKYDLVFNTVPSMVIDEDFLKNTKHSAYIIDLASKPGGINFDYADIHGIHTVHALSLPGKFFPVTAGEIIAQTAENILIERGSVYDRT